MTINLLLKNDQIVRLRPHFSFYLAVLIIIFSGNLSFAQDLGACQEIPCSATVLEISSEFPNVNVICAQNSDCSNADPARQMIYKVYLNYNIPNPPNHLPFSLDYSSIDIVINLKKVQPSTGGFSRIVEKASKLCSAQLNQWSNSELTVNGDQISFSMEDPVVGNCPDDEIIFEPQQGGGWRAYLFSIVVDAYPGETFYLECSAMTIHSDNEDCVYPPGSNNSQNLITPLATPQVTVNLPSPNIANQNLQVHSPTPVANNNGAVFSVMLKNTNVFQTNVSIEYTEFVVDLILSTAMAAPPIITTFNGIGAPLQIIDGNTYHLVFRTDPGANPYQLPTGNGALLATIQLSGPVLTNSCWNAKLSFPQDNKGRVKSSLGCGILPLSAATQFYNMNNCPPTCDKIGFEVVTVPNYDDCSFYLNIGLKDLGLPSSVLRLKSMELLVNFDKSPDLIIQLPGDLGQYGCSCSPSLTQEAFNLNAFWNPENVINLYNPVYISFELNGNGCLEDVPLNKLSITYNDGNSDITCMPKILPPTGLPFCDTKQLKGKILTFETGDGALIQTTPVYFHPPAHEGVESVTVEILPKETTTCDPSHCTEYLYTSVNGLFQGCGGCQACTAGSYTITPTLELDPLNGVNTYDLILISRHILNLEPLNSPFKLIGADANKSGTITTFDIVELRKLILGTYTELPTNKSWRFFDESITFPNLANPWEYDIEPFEKIDNVTMPNTSLNFIGVKIGDEDWTATPNNRSAQLSTESVGWNIPQGKKGDNFITIPVLYTGNQPLEGVQFSLKFNTDFLELVSPSQGDIVGYGSENFGLSKVSEGIINTLWYYNPDDPDNVIRQGNILFNLTFRIKQALPDQGGELLSLNRTNTSTNNLSWDTSDGIYQVVSSASSESMLREMESYEQSGVDLQANVLPNPTDGKIVLTLTGKKPQDMTFGIFGPYGQRILVENLKFTGTKQDFTFSELQNLPSGVFIWKLWNNDNNFSGVIVKK